MGEKKRATHLYKHTCVRMYLGLFLEGDQRLVTVVAVERALGTGDPGSRRYQTVYHKHFSVA